jgi:hypothetical protein
MILLKKNDGIYLMCFIIPPGNRNPEVHTEILIGYREYLYMSVRGHPL